jgi:hypothetical protein
MAKETQKKQMLFMNSKIWRYDFLTWYFALADKYRDRKMSLVISPGKLRESEDYERLDTRVFDPSAKMRKISLLLVKPKLTQEEQKAGRREGDCPYLITGASFFENEPSDHKFETAYERTQFVYKSLQDLVDFTLPKIEGFNYHKIGPYSVDLREYDPKSETFRGILFHKFVTNFMLGIDERARIQRKGGSQK